MTELRELRKKFPILDIPDIVIEGISSPPKTPEECIFARTTMTDFADLSTKITPCQFGGNPDCQQCGGIAFMGLSAVGHNRVVGPLTIAHLFMASAKIGEAWRNLQSSVSPKPIIQTKPSPFEIL